MKKSTVIWIIAAVVAAVLLGILMFSVLSFGKRGAENIVQTAKDRIGTILEGDLGENLPEEIQAEVEKGLREEFGEDWKQELRQELEEELGKDWPRKLQQELEQELPKDVMEDIKKEFGKDWMDEILEEDFLDEVLDSKTGHETVEAGENVRLDAREIQEIQIEWVDGNIQIRTEDVTAVKFWESESSTPMVYTLKDGKLEILFQDGIRSILKSGKVDIAKDLTVTIPRDWAGKELEIHNVSANVEVSGLTVKELEYEGVSGDFLAEDCKTDKLNVETVSGTARIFSSVKELKCDTVSGSCILLSDAVPEEISVNSVSANVELTLPEQTGYTLEFHSLSGQLDSAFEAAKNGDEYVCGDGACEIEIETVSGNASLYKPA